MGFFDEKERRVSELEAEDEVLDAEYEHMSKKAQLKQLEKELGKKELKQQIKDGMITVVRGARKLRVDRDTLEGMHGIGGLSHLRKYSDPSAWRR